MEFLNINLILAVAKMCCRCRKAQTNFYLHRLFLNVRCSLMHYLITRKELSLVIFRRINIFWPIATEELRKYSVSFRMTSDVR